MSEEIGVLNAFTKGMNHGRHIALLSVKVNIIKRIIELNECTKDDNCKEFARLLHEYIPEFLELSDDK